MQHHSFLKHPQHLILRHFKITMRWWTKNSFYYKKALSDKHTLTLKTTVVLISFLTVEVVGKISIRLFSWLSFLVEEHKVTASKWWSTFLVAFYYLLVFLRNILFPHIHLQQKRPPTTIFHSTLYHIPLVVRITCYGPTCSSSDENKSVFYIIAVLVEGCTAKFVFWGRE